MSSRSSGMTLVLAIVIVSVVIGGGALFLLSSSGGTEETKLEAALGQAQDRLALERRKLDELRAAMNESFPFHARLAQAFLRLRGALGGVDGLFDDLDIGRPKLKFNSTAMSGSVEARIIERRANINRLLREWQQKVSVALAANASQETINALIRDILEIKSFAAELLGIMESLTPDNSDLSAADILEHINDLGETLAEIDQILADLNHGAPIPPVVAPTVTPEEVIVQEHIVEAAEQEVKKAEENLNDYHETYYPEPVNYVPYQNSLLPGNPWETPGFPYTPLHIIPGPARQVEFENQF